MSKDIKDTSDAPHLKRVIGLPLLVLYGLGITIGAGIYVLVGSATELAGDFTPYSFLFAAFVMGFSALSFAEFSGRIPRAAGEAVFVNAGFRQDWLTLATGLFIVFAATIAGAAIALGCAGYVAELLPYPKPLIAAVIILLMGGLAIKGVAESVTFAGVLTLIEVAGLVVIIFAGFRAEPDMLVQFTDTIPRLGEAAVLTGILGASLVAFFAFIGFDDVVNLVEETRNPKRIMPLAIIISLVAVTVVYFLVVLVAVFAVPRDALAGSDAPVGLMFESLTGLSPLAITLIAIVATLNGVVIEIIMAARVIYGLGREGRVPMALARVSPKTQTPVNATVLIAGVMLISALIAPLDLLVDSTSQIILGVFALVNLALIRVKLRGDPAPEGAFTIWLIVPVLGAVSCLFLLFAPIVF